MDDTGMVIGDSKRFDVNVSSAEWGNLSWSLHTGTLLSNLLEKSTDVTRAPLKKTLETARAAGKLSDEG